MLMLKVCYVCDKILGEVESDTLTGELAQTIINMDNNGNVAYALCPQCQEELSIKSYPFRH